jgi:hypothetical protein
MMSLFSSRFYRIDYTKNNNQTNSGPLITYYTGGKFDVLIVVAGVIALVDDLSCVPARPRLLSDH